LIIEINKNSMNNKEILTLKTLRQKYQAQHNFEFSLETLRKHIKESFKFSFK